jgi:hypothetical protein
MNFEIVKAKNGFCIFPSNRNHEQDPFEKPWVFETLEAALEFLRDKMKDDKATCGSCHGSGFIK